MKFRCETCRFFQQHYIQREKDYVKILIGHCVLEDRPKLKRPLSTACVHYVPQAADYQE